MPKHNIDWDDPRERYLLGERIGIEEYNKAFAEHRKASIVSTVNGHAIRPIGSRFGRLFMVGDTGRAFSTQEESEAFADGSFDVIVSAALKPNLDAAVAAVQKQIGVTSGDVAGHFFSGGTTWGTLSAPARVLLLAKYAAFERRMREEDDNA